MSSTVEIFAAFQAYMDSEHDTKEDIRSTTRDIEQKAREILAVLQAIHQQDGIKNMAEVCKKVREQLGNIPAEYDKLSNKVPRDQYYRYHDHWRFVTQRLCFITSLLIYLEGEQLATRDQVCSILGLKVRREDGFHLDLDDYLIGLLQVASELSRLAVNAVTAGDYSLPLSIARFVGELDSGFRLLNLKNDALRKRFDGLKYDLKKVEEVVYDVTIRGLRPAAESTAE